MLKELLYNKWIFSFISSWVVFLLLVDWNTFTKNFWGGIAASALELWQDGFANRVSMYHIQDVGVSLFNVPIFLTFGVIFTMGILFLQYTPQKPELQLLHIIVFSIGFVIYEITLRFFGLLTEPHWSPIASFFDNTVIMGSFVWLKQYILYKTKAE